MPRALVLLAVLFSGCTCSPPPPPPYVRSHVDAKPELPCIYWARRDLTYRIDPALSARTPGDTERAAVEAAFAAWRSAGSACSDLTFTAANTSANDVVWRERSCSGVVPQNHVCHQNGTCAEDFGCWDLPEQTLAITTVTYSSSSGVLLEADISLNGASWLYTTVDSPPCPLDMPATDCVATDVQNTVTHEIGHLLGFDHAEVKGSTMEATAPPGETAKRAIDEGTREGLCAVYPRTGETPRCDGGR